MRYKIFSGIVSFVLLVVPILRADAPVRADGQTVVINELMWMGSSASSADEWIELRNLTDQAVDISGWSLTKRSSGADVPMLTIPTGKSILPNGYFLISNYVNTSANSTLNVVPDVVNTDVALSNSALQIKLYNVNQQLVDMADDGVGNPLAGSYDSAKKMYASMERNPIPGDGTIAQNWHTASRGTGFKLNATELGTPGTVNSNGVPVAHAGTDQSGIVGQNINFDGSDSVDPEMQPLIFAWDFGDGGTSSDATPSYVYAAAGAYTVTLTVSDGTDSAVDTLKATIADAPAVAPVPAPISTTPNPSSPEEGNDTATLSATTSCLGLHLSEIYPNPPGVDNDEFIELINDSDEDIVTGACVVFSSATRSYKIPAGTNVARGAYVSLPKTQTHLTLNNGGTTVRLVDSDGTELDRVVYGTAKEGASWAKVGTTWSWTTKPTPGAKNIAVAVPVATTTKKSTTTTTKTTTAKKTETPAQAVTLKDIQELDSGDRVAIEGIVTVPRDALGSTVAYIQSDDGGVNITIPNGEPTIQVGQKIQVTGTVRLKSGRRYVSVAAKGLHVLSTVTALTAVTMATDDVGVEQADQLVHVKGVVALASGSTVQIDDGSGPINVYIKSSTGIVRPKMKAGDTVDVTGIVGVSTSGVRVLPRTQNDLHVEQVLGASTVAPTQVITPPAASKSQTLWYWSLVALGALVAGAKPMWRKFREKKKATT